MGRRRQVGTAAERGWRGREKEEVGLVAGEGEEGGGFGVQISVPVRRRRIFLHNDNG